MPYRGVGSCSAKKYKVLKINALYTGTARRAPPHCPVAWLATALSTYSSNGDDSRVLTWRSQHLHSSSNSQFPTSPGLSSELQTPRVTRHGSFLLSLSLRGTPRRIPQPRIWASSASPTGLQFGGLYLLHSTVLPTTSPHCFSLWTGCMTRPSPTKVSPRGPGSTAGNLRVEARPKRGPGLARPFQIMPREAGSRSRPEGVTAGSLGTIPEPARPKLELRTHQAEVTISRAASTTAGPTNQLP